MSLRQFRKLKKQQEEQELQAKIQQEVENQSSSDSEEQSKKKGIFNQFAGLIESSSGDEKDQAAEEETNPDTVVQTQKKVESSQNKKKKKKGKKKSKKNETQENSEKKDEEDNQKQKVITDDEILQQAIAENQEKIKQIPKQQKVEFSVLSMKEKYFNSEREMRMRLQSRGIGKNLMDDLEEDKEPAQEYEGLNRKQKKMLKSMQTAHTVKKMLFVQPEKEWTILKGKSVYMESNKDEAGDKIFEFIEREPYKEVQSEFRSIQQSFDIFMMMDFMHKNMFHHQTLITVSDFLRMQGKFPDAVKLINRCMYAFEILFSKDFVICGPKPQTRINFNSEKSVLPQVLADCLVRYIDHLGRKGCCRTALEFTKFFLSLDPVNDPFGNLLKIDFYSLRCGEYKYLSTFAEKFSTEFYSHPMKTILFTPNLLLSTALAKYKLSDPCDDRTKILDKAHSDLNILGSLIHEYACEESPKILKQIYSFSAEGLIMLGLIFYPTLIKQIIIKLEADKKPNTKKSFFKGHQSDPWSKIIEHNMFEYNEDDEVLEHSLGLDSEVLSKYFDLYVDRSFECYKDDDVLDWLKQVIGYVLNEVDQDNFDRDVQFQFIFNTIGLPFELKRYSNLKKDFFNDDFTTVRPQDLLGPNAAAGNNELGGMNNAAMQANLRQMLNNRNLPPQVANAIRNQGAPRGNQDNLIIEDPNEVHEQELIMQHIAQQLRPNEEEEDFLILDSGDQEVHKQQDEEEDKKDDY